MDEKFVCQLKEELKQIDVELTERQIEQFYNYYELLIHWNSMINLTAITPVSYTHLLHRKKQCSGVFLPYPEISMVLRGQGHDRPG